MSAPGGAPHKRVQVCIRIRPPVVVPCASVAVRSSDCVVVNDTEKTISVVTNSTTGAGTCFHFDQVLDRATDQAGVYQAAAAEIVDSVLGGYNGTIMAYGQTGAGKTYTMSGGKRHFDDRGICARAISSIFHQIQRDADHAYVVRVSYVEVYNENLFDLLNFNENTPTNNRDELVIQENDKGQTFVRGLARPVVKNEEDAFDFLFQGETNRTIAEHSLNAASTRSHCIFTVYIERHANADGEIEDPASSVAVYSKLHLVDLAGSERMKRTNVSGVMLKEASHINKSLTFLEQVVIALGDKKRSHIPYRQTPLTNLLKDSLGGNCRTMLVACVWPEDSHNDQSLATLKFATRMMRVKTSAVVNISGTVGAGGSGASSKETQAVFQKYVLEIKRLKDELAMHDILSGRSLVDYDLKSSKSASARGKYREQLEEFIRDESKAPAILNLTQVEQLLSVFRDLYMERAHQRVVSTSLPDPPAPPTSVNLKESRMVKQFRALRGATPPPNNQQQDPQVHTRLPRIVRSSPCSMAVNQSCDPQLDDTDAHLQLPSPIAYSASTTVEHQLSEKELFDKFKHQEDPKPESLLDLEVAKQNLRAAKAQATNMGLEVNKVKLKIDGVTLKLQEARTSSRTLEDGIANPASVDPSIEFIVLQLRDAKKQYRDAFEQFHEKKAEVKYLLKIKEQMLQRVTREFEAWKDQELSSSSIV